MAFLQPARLSSPPLYRLLRRDLAMFQWFRRPSGSVACVVFLCGCCALLIPFSYLSRFCVSLLPSRYDFVRKDAWLLNRCDVIMPLNERTNLTTLPLPHSSPAAHYLLSRTASYPTLPYPTTAQHNTAPDMERPTHHPSASFNAISL